MHTVWLSVVLLLHLSSPQTSHVLLISLIQALIPQRFHFPLDDNSREALQLPAELGAEEMLQNHLSPRNCFVCWLNGSTLSAQQVRGFTPIILT